MKNITFAFPMHVRTVAIVTLLALVSWTLGIPAWVNNASAATVLDFTDTLSDSDVGVDAVHTITFTTQNDMNAGESFRIYFDEAGSNFDFSGVGDADLLLNAAGFTAVNACDAAGDEIDLSVGAGDYIEGTVCAGDTVPAGTITIQVGDPAGNMVNNPSPIVPTSYVISLQGHGANPIADSGDTRVAIIENVTVTATVDTIFSFSIHGVDEGQTVNDEGVPTTGTSTATTVPFGTIAPGPLNAKVMAQELRVDTNALNGFSVTVYADQTLTAGNSATIDPFTDGTEDAVPDVWSSPSGVLTQLDTYGHWGITSDDNVVSLGADWYGVGTAEYVGNFFDPSAPLEVFYHDTAVTYAQGGMGVGSTTVAYKVEITNLQEAATDYTATLTYIATPVF